MCGSPSGKVPQIPEQGHAVCSGNILRILGFLCVLFTTGSPGAPTASGMEETLNECLLKELERQVMLVPANAEGPMFQPLATSWFCFLFDIILCLAPWLLAPGSSPMSLLPIFQYANLEASSLLGIPLPGTCSPRCHMVSSSLHLGSAPQRGGPHTLAEREDPLLLVLLCFLKASLTSDCVSPSQQTSCGWQEFALFNAVAPSPTRVLGTQSVPSKYSARDGLRSAGCKKLSSSLSCKIVQSL